MNGPPGTSDLGRRDGRRGRRRGGRGEGRRGRAELVGDQHRLVVLLFVLGDHPEREPALEQPARRGRGAVEQVHHLAAHGAA